MPRPPKLVPGCALVLAALLGAACGPRYVRQEIYDEGGIVVNLRSEQRQGKPAPRGFTHPATISAVRVAHVLARIDVRMGSDEGGERVPAFPTVSLFLVGEQVARAFAKATPDQEVVVQAARLEKQFGLFHAKYLTSFVAWMKDDDLVIHLSRAEWQVPKNDEDEIPEPYVDRVVQDFKVLPSEGMVPTGQQEIAVDWRSPVFRDSGAVRVGAGGKLLRRSVLLESEAPAEGEEPKEPAILPSDLSAETLRGLADLQEQRAHGEISETTYHQRRRDLLRQAEDDRKAQEVPRPQGPAPEAPPDRNGDGAE
jgi:hypothetical protein